MRFVRRSRVFTQPLISRRLGRRSWSFVGATYDQRTGIATLYVNEKPVVTKVIGRIRLSTNYPARMGARIGDRRYFRGWITCMQVYDVALSRRFIRIAKRLCFKGIKLQMFYHQQAIAKRVETLSVIGYFLDTHNCITPPPPPQIKVERNSQ